MYPVLQKLKGWARNEPGTGAIFFKQLTKKNDKVQKQCVNFHIVMQLEEEHKTEILLKPIKYEGDFDVETKYISGT